MINYLIYQYEHFLAREIVNMKYFERLRKYICNKIK